MKAPPPGTCPTCGKPAPFVPDNPWRPFCSERCRSIDLGGWASEVYRIPAKEDEDGEPPEPAEPKDAQ